MKLSEVVYTAITLTLKEFHDENCIDEESVEILAKDLREMFRHYEEQQRNEEWEVTNACPTNKRDPFQGAG